MAPEIVTTIAVVLALLLTMAASLGVYAVYRVNKQSTTIAEYQGMAQRAKENADIWEGRSKATQAELDSAVKDLGEAQQQINVLKAQVSHLEGIVTARAEITQLVDVVTRLAETIRQDHEAQHAAHDRILEHLGAVA